jgi:cysteine-rich repeat protein
VSVVDHFKGHGACAPLLARDWIRGIYVPDAGASFHPKPRGQKEYSKPLLRRIATQIEQGDPLLPNGLPANPTPTLIPTPAPALAAPPAGPVEPLPGIDHLDIVAEPLPPCDTRGFYEPGQQVRVTGSGFTANTTVYLSFEAAENEVEDDLGTDLADPSGDLDSLVTIPSGAPTSGLATLRAVGLRDDGSALLLVSDLIGLTPSTTSDGDGDTVPDVCDVCPEVMDIMQADGDGDGIGDVCDSCAADDENDSDFDGICDAADTCPFDAADDADGDGVCADADICPLDFDPNQEDADGDGTGDACPCGDDVVDPNEACDDGNREDLDGCSSLCEEEDVWTFAGSAEGGAIDFEVDGVALSVSTSAGQSAEEVAFSVALAIDAHLTLRAAGAATVWEGGNALGINRRVSNVVITDPGISHGTSIPSLAPLGRLIVALSIPLWGLAALALRRRRRRG